MHHPPPTITRRRIRLASCCRALRSRTLTSSSLWGWLFPTLDGKPPASFDSLAAWLAAHKGGLHRLVLMPGRKDQVAAAAVPNLLHSMAGGTLAKLELSNVPAGADVRALGQLQLTRLRILSWGTKVLPAELASLPLAELDLGGCWHLNTDAALAPLAHLGASLTSLKMEHCRLAGRIPAPLRALSALCKLRLDVGEDWATVLQEPPPPTAPDAFAPLACLSALTSLTLGGLGFCVLPTELSALPGLKVRMWLPDQRVACSFLVIVAARHTACRYCLRHLPDNAPSRLCLPCHRVPSGGRL